MPHTSRRAPEHIRASHGRGKSEPRRNKGRYAKPGAGGWVTSQDSRVPNRGPRATGGLEESTATTTLLRLAQRPLAMVDWITQLAACFPRTGRSCRSTGSNRLWGEPEIIDDFSSGLLLCWACSIRTVLAGANHKKAPATGAHTHGLRLQRK